ncbi:MAG: iron ABC transporter substrate-binding protein [Deltaproteobacteria bacterium]|nr:iron ABC transporter substrate-binding protein [Deltaproteobacteria bacterium]
MTHKNGLHVCRSIFLMFVLGLFLTDPVLGRMVTDGAGRQVEIPLKIEHVICSGPGTLRLLTYLQAQDCIVAVDDMEKRRPQFDARPYALAHPRFREYPVFGEFRGHDHPELILTLSPLPQVIFKISSITGHDPVEVSQKTGIPVVILNYGDLGKNRRDFYQSLRIMGEVMGRRKRAEEVIAFFESRIVDLKDRTAAIPDDRRPTCFVGGIAYRGPHGFQSTEPVYPPFTFVGARNMAYDPALADRTLQYSCIAKEKILIWDPDILFLDLSTRQMGDKSGGLYELKTDVAYQSLTAVQSGKVYGVLPYNWYTLNFGSILADAYFIGSLLYPEKFFDIDPVVTADEIYTFLVGKPVFQQMNAAFGGLVFQPVPLK